MSKYPVSPKPRAPQRGNLVLSGRKCAGSRPPKLRLAPIFRPIWWRPPPRREFMPVFLGRLRPWRLTCLGQVSPNLDRFLYSCGMGLLNDAHELSVTEATQRGVAGLVADAEQGADLVVTRRHHPVAAVVSMRRLAELDEAAADLRDLALVLARAATDAGRRTSLDEVLQAFGHTRESLAELPDE
jgi:antitoxin (DNA-binding transcriptional repressor) of toxin-antitoxin stability system